MYVVEEISPVRIGLHTSQHEHLPQTEVHYHICYALTHFVLRVEQLVQWRAVYELRRYNLLGAQFV